MAPEGMLFGIGMCMCLLPEWNAFIPGVVVTTAGAVELLRRLDRSVETPGIIVALIIGIAGMLIIETGMCCIMVWNKILAPQILKLTEELERQ